MSLTVTIVRHPMENRAKCSLTPLEGRPGFRFHTAGDGFSLDGSGHTLLALDAPAISPADAGRPLLLLDSTWRHLPTLRACVTGEPAARSLPPVTTAYPRVSKLFQDPAAGLASVEALYLAARLLGERDDSLLDGYRWRETFLERCAEY